MADEAKNNVNEEELENEEIQNQEENESGQKEENKSGKEDNKGSKGSGGKTFTQDQVNRMMTREKNQGRNSVYKELGIDPKDTKMVNMFKSFIESQKTDEQKAAEQEAENKNKVIEAEQRAMVAEAKAEAMMLGVKSQYVDDVVTLALSKMTDDSDMKTIIGEFKTKYPVWFGESDKEDNKEEKKKAGQKGTGSSVKNSDKEKKGEEKGLGARLAAQRKSSGKKQSCWGSK